MMLSGILQQMDYFRSQARILVCDDEPINAEVIKGVLEGIFKVDVVYSGEEVLEYCEKFTPDLIILDILMHGQNGMDTCQQLKKDPSLRHIPVIFVTSLNSGFDEIRCWDVGCVDFISKPINAPTLINRVRTHVDHKLKTDELTRLTCVDNLTSCYNRHYLSDLMPRLIRQARRDKHPLSVAMIDIDWFKRYNDTYGHLKGDQCLTQIANLLKDSLYRPTDTLIRFGGEEFLALLPSTSLISAEIICQRMLERVASTAIDHQSSPLKHITLSIGACTITPESEVKMESLIQLADERLYQAKQAGRNQLSLLECRSSIRC
ncbi:MULTISPECIES: diguanylate cyclase [unclassified Vibrio]|uniref:diguanylate cyclase n=1 Tax=Vibrio sp. HB236076 TaxID=3232307 RepID=A0AB39HED9_9VIBR|nr:diguanylate cyclase [Vibrio sp. HB161653]MDP5255458.1 diguanylate cyclase [Vibrio sp. HB161653]